VDDAVEKKGLDGNGTCGRIGALDGGDCGLCRFDFPSRQTIGNNTSVRYPRGVSAFQARQSEVLMKGIKGKVALVTGVFDLS
jgi:hypothetical protein